MRARGTLRLAAVCSLAVLAGCAAPAEQDEHVGQSREPLTAYCQANVTGIGLVDTETTYLPSVVHCENGGAPFEALKAQAIAARTYLYYKMETAGSIADGAGDQVYSCGSGPTAEQIKAVADTAGQVLRYKGVTICSFFVAGGAGTPPDCIGSSAAATEKYVTYNAGKSGSGITQTTLGWVSPTNYRNRGCLSQLGSRCLDSAGKKVGEILPFYYGDDIVLETATGPCVPTPDAGVDAGPVDTGSPDSGVEDTGAGGESSGDSAAADTSVRDAGEAADSMTIDDATTGDGARSTDPANEWKGSCAYRATGVSAHPTDSASDDALYALAFAAAGIVVARRRRGETTNR